MEDWEWCGVTLSASTKPRGHELGSSDRLGIREPFVVENQVPGKVLVAIY